MTKGERREQKHNKSRKMPVHGRNTGALYQAAILKNAKEAK